MPAARRLSIATDGFRGGGGGGTIIADAFQVLLGTLGVDVAVGGDEVITLVDTTLSVSLVSLDTAIEIDDLLDVQIIDDTLAIEVCS